MLRPTDLAQYYGFVTGGVTEVALLADLLVTSYDANVQVHLPTQTLATSLEARTLALALDLLNLPREAFLGRTLTTGATAANVAGLACARDALFLRGTKTVPEGWVIAEDGYPPGGAQVEILGARVHASVRLAPTSLGGLVTGSLSVVLESGQVLTSIPYRPLPSRSSSRPPPSPASAGATSSTSARASSRSTWPACVSAWRTIASSARPASSPSALARSTRAPPVARRAHLSLARAAAPAQGAWLTVDCCYSLQRRLHAAGTGPSRALRRVRRLAAHRSSFSRRRPSSRSRLTSIETVRQDAAFGAFAAALPELAHYVKDLELADSIVVRACVFVAHGLYALC